MRKWFSIAGLLLINAVPLQDFAGHANRQVDTDVAFQIDFQDFFSKDFVELRVNTCTVWADTLTSDKSDGFADLRINAFLKKGEPIYFIRYRDKSVECGSGKGELNLIVTVNGRENQFKIDFSKGRYIGFSKKSKNELYIKQSEKAFVYD